jgi:hypothetical protein
LLQKLEAKGQMDDWNRELRQIDPYLELVFAPENATAPGLRPGRYHVLRHNPGAPLSLIPIETPEGEFKEPDSSLLDELRRADLWRDEAVRDRKKRQEALERSERRRKAREFEERQEEIEYRIKVKESPGVLVSDVPWTWRAHARKAKHG